MSYKNMNCLYLNSGSFSLREKCAEKQNDLSNAFYLRSKDKICFLHKFIDALGSNFKQWPGATVSLKNVIMRSMSHFMAE